ncbi:deoxycytidylate deaminase-like [Tubulanus polymorphus]|uniref:deoxycytidylate deaminase-like n=1 Tax=Tubulanus polymorphus TaxID=672921 RepID=UPI003DA37BB6
MISVETTTARVKAESLQWPRIQLTNRLRIETESGKITYLGANGIALLSAQRSKDPALQVGACIVDKDNRIMGVGYNGMPLKCSDDEMNWGIEGAPLETKRPYECCAEMNAIAFRNCASLKGCTIYVTFFPCNECTKIIIQSGIEEVIYLSHTKRGRDEYEASKIMLEKAKVKVVKYEVKEGGNEKVILNYKVDE